MVVRDGESSVVTGSDLVVGAMVAWYHGYSSGDRESVKKTDAFRSFARDVLSGDCTVAEAARRSGFYPAKGKNMLRTFIYSVVPEMAEAGGIDEALMETLAWVLERHADEISVRDDPPRTKRRGSAVAGGENGACV
jgi:hypothetical protein